MKSIYPWGVLGAAIVIVVVAVMWQQGSPAKSYTIGSVVPLTGAGANLGVPYIQGMQMAVDEINNKGGINGKKLVMAAQDGALDGGKSVSAAQQIVAANKPDIMTVMFHLPAQAISPVLQKEGVPMLYQAYTRSMLQNPLAFKGDIDSEVACEQLIAYAKAHKTYKKLGALLAQAEYSDLCIEGIKKVDPDVVVYPYQFGTTDFRTLLTKANADKVDALVVITIDPEGVLMFKQLSELKYPIKFMCVTASECIYPAVAAAASPQLVEGTYGIDFIPPAIDSTAVAKRYNEKYPNATFTDYTWMSVGYEDAQIISTAMAQCSAGDRTCLTESLKNVHGYESVIGSHGFKDRILQTDNKIYQYRNSKWVEVE